jgi:hypothetical protein
MYQKNVKIRARVKEPESHPHTAPAPFKLCCTGILRFRARNIIGLMILPLVLLIFK